LHHLLGLLWGMAAGGRKTTGGPGRISAGRGGATSVDFLFRRY
jgi:hypothetical protein